jgi:hypothetical protein
MLNHMELRHSAMPDDPDLVKSADGTDPPDDAATAGEPMAVSFRVDGRFTAMKVVGALIFLAIAIIFHEDPARSLFAGLAGLVTGIYAIRDVSAPVRLAADADGVTVVSGFTARRRLAWDQIEQVRVERRRRLGTHSDMLEIDAGDSLHLFSSYDLGVTPGKAARALAGLTHRLPDRAEPPSGQTEASPDS